MDRFRMLEVFVRVADLASFTRAADALDLPRATVTELVQALEARLECTLLHRTTRRVALTPEGAAFYERATRILQALEDAESDLDGARDAQRLGHVHRRRRRGARARPDPADGLRALADRRRGAAHGARRLVGAAVAALRHVAAAARPVGAVAGVRRMGDGAVSAAAGSGRRG
jgi:DNA-binding MarR family transcriptional regulator